MSTQVHSGQVLRIDPRTGDKTVLANLTPGLDNVTFVGKRTFVSNISGYVTEILEGGQTRDLVPDGFNWPLGLAVDSDGTVYVADGPFSYTLRPGQPRQQVGFLFTPGYPGYSRGVAAAGAGEFVVTTANGEVARYWPAKHENQVLASGFDQLYGVAIAPKGAVVLVEQGTGRVLSVQSKNVETLATGLKLPSGVTVGADGTCFVSESAGGRVVKLSAGRAVTVVDDLRRPPGHPRSRRLALHRRCWAQRTDRIQSHHRKSSHARVRSAGRPSAWSDAEGAESGRHAVRADGPVRRHRRWR